MSLIWEAAVLWRQLDAEGVLGGWNICDFAPTLISSFGGIVVSWENESGIIGRSVDAISGWNATIYHGRAVGL